MPPVFIQADWINVEGRLTAHFSGDVKLQERLTAELHGGPKVHSLHAALLFGSTHGVTVETAKRVEVPLQGQLVAAYDAGKRLTHGWNYGMQEKLLGEQFWLPVAEAARISRLLAEEYPGVVRWRERLADTVFGVQSLVCGRCGYEATVQQDCPTCSVGRIRVPLKWNGWKSEPARELRTPFGRRRLYLGRRGESANAVTSQLPQSSGASMWNRTLMRLHGFEVVDGMIFPWPTPEGTLKWQPGESYHALLNTNAPIRVALGTYDSFLLRVESEAQVEEARSWLLWTMEQPWAELLGRRFPADVAVGYNWGPKDERCRYCNAPPTQHVNGYCTSIVATYLAINPTGLTDYHYTPLTAKFK